MPLPSPKYRSWTLAFLILAPGLLCLSTHVHAQTSENLFTATSPSKAATARAEQLTRDRDAIMLRQRTAEVDVRLLTREEAETITLNLFNGTTYQATRTKLVTRQANRFTWTGKADGDAWSSVVMVVERGEVTAHISAHGKTYQVSAVGDGLHVVWEVDPAALPETMCGTLPAQAKTPDEKASPKAFRGGPSGGVAPSSLSLLTRSDLAKSDVAAADPIYLDVLVVYTPSARTTPGNLQAEIQLAIDQTNLTYENSEIDHRLRLVGTAEIDYAQDTDMSQDLYRLQSPDDGFMDDVHALRDDHQADIVSLWVGDVSNYCGFGYIMTDLDPLFERFAFNVVARPCATINYIFGHEVGHNTGAQHDWYVDSNIWSFPYSHGYVNAAKGWRTVMAYHDECSDAGAFCQTIPFWSNPDLLYGGDPLGVPDGLPNPADNRLVFRQTAPVAATFRGPPPEATVSPSRLALVLGEGDAATETLTLGNTGEGPLLWELVPQDPIGLQMAYNEPFVQNGLAVRVAAPGGSLPASYSAPDAFGYRWASSDAPGGPTFDWFNIAERGEALALFDDDGADVALPFPFPFYGQNQNRVTISSNGYLTFDGFAVALGDLPIPSPDAPSNLIAPFWDDLNPSEGGTIHHYHDAAANRFVVQYTAVPRFPSEGQMTFQVLLYPSGDVLFQYQRMTGTKNEATVGFGNAPFSWVTATPMAGLVLADASQEMDLRISAARLSPGLYSEQLTFATNDPDRPTLTVPIELTVSEQTTTGEDVALPIASISASSHDGNAPANVLDGDPATRWSARGQGEWIAFGLGGIAARYVRIVGRGNSERGAVSKWTSVTEARLFTPVTAAGVEALPIASVSASSHDGNAPAKVLDGDPATRWSARGQGEWITLDVGAVRDLGRLEIAWYKGDERRTRFDVEVSSNNSQWTHVFSSESTGHTLSYEAYPLTVAYDLARLDVAWYKGDERRTRFDVEVSEDGSAWSRVLSDESSGATLDYEPYTLTRSAVRYVRVVGRGNSERGAVKRWTSITGLRLFGEQSGGTLAAGANGARPASPSAPSAAAQGGQPTTYALEPAYPNPFNPSTEIAFALPEDAHVQLGIHDVLGREVARLVDGSLAAGHHRIRFEANGLASGVYLYRITAGPFTQTRRMVLLK